MQWASAKKIGILIVVSLYSFLGNSALLGPSVYLVNFAMEFNIDVNKASGLVSYPNLAYGFGKNFRLSMRDDVMILTLGCSRVTAPRTTISQDR